MGSISYGIPTVGQPNSTEDPKIATALQTLLTFANGGIDTGNLAASSGILTIAGALSAHKVAFGALTLTGPFSVGSPYSNNLTVTHGLGTTPTVIIPAVWDGDCFVSVVGVPGSTTFQVLGHCVVGAWSRSPAPGAWIAIA